MNQEQADKLRVMADHLEQNVADENFTIKLYRCGSVACALGHAAAVLPEHFRYDPEQDIFDIIGADGAATIGGSSDRSTVGQIFGITRNEVDALFYHRYATDEDEANNLCRGRMDVVRDIRELLHKYGYASKPVSA